MKNLVTTAIVSAVVAALVASGATYAAMKINGHSIALHSIPLNRIEGKLPRGPRGPRGIQGETGTMGKITVESTSIQLTPGITGFGIGCAPGSVAISGGFGPADVNDTGYRIIGSMPDTVNGDTAWDVIASPTSSTPVTVDAYSVCVPSS